MASALKRKRGPVEVLDAPKRSKSVKNQSVKPSRQVSDKVGWETAFNPPQDLVTPTNGVNGSHSRTTPDSPVAVDYEDYVQAELYKAAIQERERPSNNVRQEIKKKASVYSAKKKAKESWKLSEPIGGRMINADPVFTTDEKYEGRK